MNRLAASATVAATFLAAAAILLTVGLTPANGGVPVLNNLWLLSGFCLFAIAFIVMTIGASTAVVDLVSRSRTPFLAEFDPLDASCYQRRESIADPDLQLRLRVRNVASRDLVSVKAEFVHLPTQYRHRVRIMHDNDPYCQLSNVGSDLHSQEKMYFDIVYTVIGDSLLFFQYADNDLIDTQYEEPVTRRAHRVEIEISGRWAEGGGTARPLRVQCILEPVGVDDLYLAILRRGKVVPGERNLMPYLAHNSPSHATVAAAIQRNRTQYRRRRASRHG